MTRYTKPLVPLAAVLILLLAPCPPGLAPHAWRYVAVFVGVVLALVTEPLPGAAVGIVGVAVVALLSQVLLFGPAELARPGFDRAAASLTWALSGFSNGTVWLIVAAFMFALGYERTGLGRRLALHLVKALGRRTLSLGYAIAAADLLLAPFTPSNTARSAGTIFPVVRCLPPLYDSLPNSESARRIGSYLMWTALASTCVTSSLFMTALAPNLLAVELVRKATGLEIAWSEWFYAFAPVGLPLLLAVPLLTYWLYPPQVRSGAAVPQWAAGELQSLGPLSWREVTMATFACGALASWIFAGAYVSPTTTALAVLAAMLVTGVVSWDDMLRHTQAWNTFVWFGTLVPLADGLNRTGVVAWLAAGLSAPLSTLPPPAAAVLLVCAFFVTHYLFASVTAHTTALLPVMLAVSAAVPGLPLRPMALMLVTTLGIMGVLTPYGTGPSPVYYGSGYLPARDFWRLGAVFGAFFLAMFLAVGVPWLLAGG